MSVTLSDSVRIARKSHKCWYCNQSIDVGTRYGYRTGIGDGRYWSMHFHEECDVYAQRVFDWDYETYLPSYMSESEQLDFRLAALALNSAPGDNK